MAKQIQQEESIYLVPGITGEIDNSGKLVIKVEATEKELYPEKNIEDKIRMFERQVNGWFLEQAFTLLTKEDNEVNENNGFVILMIATSYIEGIEQYRQGKSSHRRSKSFFKKGIKRIFEVDSNDYKRLDDFYSELRCSLFHNGMTGPYIRIHSVINDKPIVFSEGKIIKINQKLFLEKVGDDFNNYLEDLKDKSNKELRTNFNKMYKFQ